MVNFIVTYDESIIVDLGPDTSYKEKTIIGQLPGLFEAGDWIGNAIKEKYSLHANFSTKEIIQELRTINSITFELTPYTLVDVLYKNETVPTRIMVGRSGVYHLSSDYAIDNVRIVGIRMVHNQNAEPKELDPWEYRTALENEVAGNRNTVYGNSIYYNGKLYEYTQESDNVIVVKAPVEGYVTYTGDILQDIYTKAR